MARYSDESFSTPISSILRKMVNVSDNLSSLVFGVLDIDYKGISPLDWGKKSLLFFVLCDFVFVRSAL